MEIEIAPLVSSCDTSNFVGRKRVTDRFYEWLNDMTIMKKPQNQWVHITGVPGSGKSSLLEKFREMAIAERVRDVKPEPIYFPQQFQESLNTIFTRIDEITPEWRSFLQRRTKTNIVEFPPNFIEVIESSEVSSLASELLKNFESVTAKLKESGTIIGIFIDDLDNMDRYGGRKQIDLLMEIILKIGEMSDQIFFVTTSINSLTESLGIQNLGDTVTLLSIDAFDINESELMIRRRERLDKDDREEIALASSRLPIDIALRTALFLAGHEFRIVEMENLTELFGLTDEETDVFAKLATEERNYFEVKKLEEKFGRKLIDNLVKQGVLTADDVYATVPSNSLWEIITSFFLPTDVRTELLLTVSRINDRVADGNLPSTKELELVQTGVNQVKDISLLYEISGKLIEIIDLALDHEIIYTAWEILQLANVALVKANDKEKLAEMNEKFGSAFGRVGHEYYAAQAFQKAAELFKEMGASGKISAETNFREAGLRYRKEAESMDVKTFHYAMRAMYAKSIRAFLAADEQGSVQEVKKYAIEVFKEYPEHQAFIRKVDRTE